jgi:hypothetical protein
MDRVRWKPCQANQKKKRLQPHLTSIPKGSTTEQPPRPANSEELMFAKFNSWRLSFYTDPHKSLDIKGITDTLPSGWEMIALPMPTPFSDHLNGAAKKINDALWKMLAHFVELAKIAVNFRKMPEHKIIVREFLTIPLLIAAPIIWRMRGQVYFLCNHNIAFANRSTPQKLSLRLLKKLGYQFAIFEDITGWTKIDEKTSNDVIAIHPCKNVFRRIAADTHKPIQIGFVGSPRHEKPLQPYLNQVLELARSLDTQCEVVIGLPKNLHARYQNLGATLIDTTSDDDYRLCLSKVDILILPYAAEHYSDRVSGIASDAISFGATPVSSDLNSLRRQIQHPSKVGFTFSGIHGLEPALIEAIEFRKSEDFPRNMNAYIEYRSNTFVEALRSRS